MKTIGRNATIVRVGPSKPSGTNDIVIEISAAARAGQHGHRRRSGMVSAMNA